MPKPAWPRVGSPRLPTRGGNSTWSVYRMDWLNWSRRDCAVWTVIAVPAITARPARMGAIAFTGFFIAVLLVGHLAEARTVDVWVDHERVTARPVASFQWCDPRRHLQDHRRPAVHVPAGDTPLEHRLIADEGDPAEHVRLEPVGLRERLVLVHGGVEDQAPLEYVPEGELVPRRARREPGRDPGAELPEGRLDGVALAEVQRDVCGQAEGVGAALDGGAVVGDGVLMKHRTVPVREHQRGTLQREHRDGDPDRPGRLAAGKVPLAAHEEQGAGVVIEVVDQPLGGEDGPEAIATVDEVLRRVVMRVREKVHSLGAVNGRADRYLLVLELVVDRVRLLVPVDAEHAPCIGAVAVRRRENIVLNTGRVAPEHWRHQRAPVVVSQPDGDQQVLVRLRPSGSQPSVQRQHERGRLRPLCLVN